MERKRTFISFGVRALNDGGRAAINVRLAASVGGTEIGVKGPAAIRPEEWFDTSFDVARPALVDLDSAHSEPILRGDLIVTATYEGAGKPVRVRYGA